MSKELIFPDDSEMIGITQSYREKSTDFIQSKFCKPCKDQFIMNHQRHLAVAVKEVRVEQMLVEMLDCILQKNTQYIYLFALSFQTEFRYLIRKTSFSTSK